MTSAGAGPAEPNAATEPEGRPSAFRRRHRSKTVSERFGRGQANLLALGVALIVLTSVSVVAIAQADGALAGATRSPDERRAATQLSDRLVAAEGPTAYRASVVNESAVTNLTAARVDDSAPAVRGRSVRIRLGGQTVFERGSPDGGTTVRRLVLAGERTAAVTPVDLDADDTLALGNRTARIRIAFGSDADVDTVRVDGRIVLHDPIGLSGIHVVGVSRSMEPTITFEDVGGPEGAATVTHYPANATPTELAVTVDA